MKFAFFECYGFEVDWSQNKKRVQFGKLTIAKLHKLTFFKA